LADDTVELKQQLARAQHMLENIRRGERHLRGPSGGPMKDVTEEHREHYEKMAEVLAKIIAAREA
jgi:hypothetical protein